MKKSLLFLVASICLAATLLFNSCTKMDVSSKDVILETEFERDLELITLAGFNTDGVIDMGDSYLVEGDIMLEKDILRSTPQTRQAYNSTYGLALNSVPYTVYTPSSIPTKLRDAVVLAINEWNSIIGSNVKFRHTTSSSGTIKISTFTDYSGTIAWAYVAQNDKPGKEVSFNLNYSHYSTNQMKAVIMHELGHTVGVKHTDWQNNGETGVKNIPGTPTSDPNSIFNSHYDTNISNFSVEDINAIRVLFPGLNNCEPASIPKTTIRLSFGHSSSYSVKMTNHDLITQYLRYAICPGDGYEILSSTGRVSNSTTFIYNGNEAKIRFTKKGSVKVEYWIIAKESIDNNSSKTFTFNYSISAF